MNTCSVGICQAGPKGIIGKTKNMLIKNNGPTTCQTGIRELIDLVSTNPIAVLIAANAPKSIGIMVALP